jgi:hypothetical protein
VKRLRVILDKLEPPAATAAAAALSAAEAGRNTQPVADTEEATAGEAVIWLIKPTAI